MGGAGADGLAGGDDRPSRRRRTEFQRQMNVRFGLDHLRPMEAADIQAGEARDRLRSRRRSIGAAADAARRAGGRADARASSACSGGRRRSVRRRSRRRSSATSASCDAYVTAHGAVFLDDTGDPALTLDMYEDGDHLARDARRRYTEHFYNRLGRTFRDLPQPRLHRLLRRRRRGLLAAAAPRRRTSCCWSRAISSTATSIRGSCS